MKLSNILLNNPWVKEETIVEISKYFELNYIKHTLLKLEVVATASFQGKYIALNARIKKVKNQCGKLPTEESRK